MIWIYLESRYYSNGPSQHDLHDGCEINAENVGEYEITGIFLKPVGCQFSHFYRLVSEVRLDLYVESKMFD